MNLKFEMFDLIKRDMRLRMSSKGGNLKGSVDVV